MKTAKSKATVADSKGKTAKTSPAKRAISPTKAPPRRAIPVISIATAAASREITPDLIAQRAYIIWEQQGRPHGQDVQNWLLAERQLQNERSFPA